MKKISNIKKRTIFITIILIIVSLELLCTGISEKISTKGIINNLFAFTRGQSAGNVSEILTEDTVAERTTLDNFEINITELPEVSVTKNPQNYDYTINVGSRGVRDNCKYISFPNLPKGEWVDLEITARFNNAFTIDNKQGDLVIVYSNICTQQENDRTS